MRHLQLHQKYDRRSLKLRRSKANIRQLTIAIAALSLTTTALDNKVYGKSISRKADGSLLISNKIVSILEKRIKSGSIEEISNYPSKNLIRLYTTQKDGSKIRIMLYIVPSQNVSAKKELGNDLAYLKPGLYLAPKTSTVIPRLVFSRNCSSSFIVVSWSLDLNIDHISKCNSPVRFNSIKSHLKRIDEG